MTTCPHRLHLGRAADNSRGVTRAEREHAALLDRDRSRLDRIGARQAQAITVRMRAAAIRALQSGQDPAAAAMARLDDLKPLLLDGMVAGHMAGRRRALLTAAPRMRRKTKLANTVYDDAIAFLRARLRLDEDAMNALVQTYTPEAVRITTELRDDVQVAIIEAVESGAGVRDAVRLLRASLGGATDSDLESIFRTQTQIAFSAGRWAGAQAPEVWEALWGFKYVTVGDDRVRLNHVALDGVTLPKDDPLWDSITVPNGWNCRCQMIEQFTGQVTRRPERMTTIDGMFVAPGPDDGFAFNPGRVFATMTGGSQV